jgi:hypothetical protein
MRSRWLVLQRFGHQTSAHHFPLAGSSPTVALQETMVGYQRMSAVLMCFAADLPRTVKQMTWRVQQP